MSLPAGLPTHPRRGRTCEGDGNLNAVLVIGVRLQTPRRLPASGAHDDGPTCVVVGAPFKNESRQCAFGRTDAGRLLAVVFTVRGSLLRVISVRPMSRRERRGYGQASDS